MLENDFCFQPSGGVPDKHALHSDDDDQDFDTSMFDLGGGGGGNNARLAAALNAANERRGEENLTYLFDQDIDPDNTAL